MCIDSHLCNDINLTKSKYSKVKYHPMMKITVSNLLKQPWLTSHWFCNCYQDKYKASLKCNMESYLFSMLLFTRRRIKDFESNLDLWLGWSSTFLGKFRNCQSLHQRVGVWGEKGRKENKRCWKYVLLSYFIGQRYVFGQILQIWYVLPSTYQNPWTIH